MGRRLGRGLKVFRDALSKRRRMEKAMSGGIYRDGAGVADDLVAGAKVVTGASGVPAGSAERAYTELDPRLRVEVRAMALETLKRVFALYHMRWTYKNLILMLLDTVRGVLLEIDDTADSKADFVCRWADTLSAEMLAVEAKDKANAVSDALRPESGPAA
jgi:hypothetical protein